jgi:hypothetical protein
MMSFKVKGKILQVLPEQKGTSQRGEWKKQDFVIETTDDQFAKKICFTLFNDKTSSLENVKPNMEVEVSFSIESREYNQKWYTNVNAFRVESIKEGNNQGMSPPPYNEADIPPLAGNEENDDLPF